METALRMKLKAYAPLAARVASRIDWTVHPEPKKYPYVVLQVASDPQPETFKGPVGFRETGVQLDVYGLTRAEVVAVRKDVIAALRTQGFVAGVRFGRAFINNTIDRSGKTDNGFVHRDLIDARIWHDG